MKIVEGTQGTIAATREHVTMRTTQAELAYRRISGEKWARIAKLDTGEMLERWRQLNVSAEQAWLNLGHGNIPSLAPVTKDQAGPVIAVDLAAVKGKGKKAVQEQLNGHRIKVVSVLFPHVSARQSVVNKMLEGPREDAYADLIASSAGLLDRLGQGMIVLTRESIERHDALQRTLRVLKNDFWVRRVRYNRGWIPMRQLGLSPAETVNSRQKRSSTDLKLIHFRTY